jgi:hypothetical protein
VYGSFYADAQHVCTLVNLNGNNCSPRTLTADARTRRRFGVEALAVERLNAIHGSTFSISYRAFGSRRRASERSVRGSQQWQRHGLLRNQVLSNFGLGSATQEQSDAVGQAWVGGNARLTSEGKSFMSEDGVRQYRRPSYKARLGMVQSNLESRPVPHDAWQTNGHLDTTDVP